MNILHVMVIRLLEKFCTEMTPEQVIKEVKDSGQRGRGGAGFSTGLKWELARKNHLMRNMLSVMPMRAIPGAFMDRSVLEGDPHSVLEAMAICGYSYRCNKRTDIYPCRISACY